MAVAVLRDPLDDIHRLTLAEAALGIRHGRFTAEALARRYLMRVRSHESKIHAWAWLDEERMLSLARQADAELRAGRLRGPLHGVPIGVKDIFHTRGIPTHMGSPAFEGFVPGGSAACVELLEAAGAYVQGKTITTEFATQHPGPTANPWDTSCTPGGSSSGSAAAVASGFTPAALASQTRGSTIRPAAYCGVVGFKPSFGLVSTLGVLKLSAPLDHVGVIARTVDDAALLASQLVSTDAGGLSNIPAHGLGDCESPQLAVIRTRAWQTAELAQQALFDANCAVLRGRGARITELELPHRFDSAWEAARTVQLYDLAQNFGVIVANAPGKISAMFLALCEQGAGITTERYTDALAVASMMRRDLRELCAPFDGILTLPVAGEALPTRDSTGDAAFNTLWTLCGWPCVTIPTGLGPRSLPMGLQVVGSYLEDSKTLRVAKWCAECLPFDHLPGLR